MDAVACHLRVYEDNLFSSLISSVEKLSDKLFQEFQQFKEGMFYSPPVWTHLYGPMLMTVSIGSRKRIWKVHTVGYPVVLAGRPQRGQEELGWKTYLDPRDMGTWTVRKTVPNGGSSRKAATPISSGWFPRHSGRAEFTPDPIEILIHFFKKQALLDVVGF